MSARQSDETGALRERLRNLIASTAEERPYVHGESVWLYCGKAGKHVEHTVMVRPNSHMTEDLPPEKQYATCSTGGCMSMPKPPIRYRVTRDVLRDEAARALPVLLDALDRVTPPGAAS